MKNLIISFVLICSLQANAQEKKDLMISLGIGAVGTPQGSSFKSLNTGIAYTIDIDYFIAKRHIFAVSYTSGNHEYLYNPYSTNSYPFTTSISPYTVYTSEIEFRNFSLIYKYRIINRKHFSIGLGTGVSFLTMITRFPIYELEKDYWNFKFFAFGGGTDLAFPLKADISYQVSNKWSIGLIGGVFIMPRHSLLASHICPRISYTIK